MIASRLRAKDGLTRARALPLADANPGISLSLGNPEFRAESADEIMRRRLVTDERVQEARSPLAKSVLGLEASGGKMSPAENSPH
jgi:hypothetical protein